MAAVSGVTGVVFVALVVVAAMLGTLFGAFAGWVVSWIFPEVIIRTLARFGVNTSGLQMWELGATLGFIGAFFKATLNSSKSS